MRIVGFGSGCCVYDCVHGCSAFQSTRWSKAHAPPPSSSPLPYPQGVDNPSGSARAAMLPSHVHVFKLPDISTPSLVKQCGCKLQHQGQVRHDT